jgi:nitroreductase
MKLLLKRILPPRIVECAKRVRHGVRIQIARIASASGVGASVYYLFSSDFRREQRGVLLGRLHFWAAASRNDYTYYQLRRNIHRLEKGLIMRPRRPSFASEYIGDTVTLFDRAQRSPIACEQELSWAEDVLKAYFEAVTAEGSIAEAKDRFLASRAECDKKEAAFCPYPHERLAVSDVSYEQFDRLCTRRRSVRWFLPIEVERSKLDLAFKTAGLAPSACNRQPFAFHVRMGKQAAEMASLPGGAGGFAENIPCCVAVVGDLSAYPLEKDRHLIYIDGALASMQLMLALETLGLSSCPLNWPDTQRANAAIQRALGLRDFHHTIMLIAIGHADPGGGIPYSAKRSIDKMIKLSGA